MSFLGILCQPSCIGNLLHFLVDQELSPHLTQTVIVLLQNALPTLSTHQLNELKLELPLLNTKEESEVTIVGLLLQKLGHFIVPSFKVEESNNELVNHDKVGEGQESPPSLDEISTQALMLHKRPDQSGHELIQQLLNASSDIGIFSAMGSDSMEKVIRIDKDINQRNCAEVMCGDPTRIMRAATKMAQLGFVVSIACPNQLQDSSNGWKQRTLQVCLERNNVVAQKSPSRPFISNTVANKLASEIIILVHRLASCNNHQWMCAIRSVVTKAFFHLGEVIACAPPLNCKEWQIDWELVDKAQNVVAALAVVGGFSESIKPGSNVKLKDSTSESKMVEGIVKQVIKEHNIAIVGAISPISDEVIDLTVSLSKITIEDSIPEASRRLFGCLALDLIPVLQSILLPNDAGLEALCLPLTTSAQCKHANSFSRVIAEIRTKCCQILANFLKNEDFARSFLMQSCQSVDMLKYFAKDVMASDKLCCTEYLCENLRGKFRDLVKPSLNSAAPSSNLSNFSNETRNHFNTMQIFPPLKSVVFYHDLTSVQYFGTPVTSIGNPRGVVLQAIHGVSARSYDFSIQILSLGDNDDDSGAPTISVGLSPPNVRRDGAWNPPEGAVMLHSNARNVLVGPKWGVQRGLLT